MRKNAISVCGLSAIWAMVLGCGLVWGGKPVWTLFYALTAFMLYAGLTVMLCFQGLESKREVRERYVGGRDAEVIVELKIISWVPLLWLMLKETWIHENTGERLTYGKMVFPWFRRSITFRYAMKSLPRGVYRFESLIAATGDAFGIFEKTRTCTEGRKFVVLPKPLAIENLAISAGGDGPISLQTFLSPLSPQMSGIREYVQGDPLNRIHWRSSARSEGWKSRTSEPARSLHLFVYLDTGSFRPGDLFEQAVGLAAGLIQYGTDRRIGVALHCGVSDGAGEMHPADRFRMNPQAEYERLAEAKPWEKMEQAESGSDLWMVKADENTMVICITHFLGERLLAQLQGLKAKGNRLIVLYMNSKPLLGTYERQCIERLESYECPVKVVSLSSKAGGRIADASA
jgi:uncharacterized protein (DUF58 family)